MALAVLLTLLVGQGLVFGDDDDRREPGQLEGTWDVTLTFDNCADPATPPTPDTPGCSCPPGLTVSGLHMYLKNGSYLDVSGANPLRGPALGSWERVGHHWFEARYKFFLFNTNISNGVVTGFSRGGYEEVTNRIHLTGPDTFEAEAIFHLFNAEGKETSPPNDGCPIHETAQRFE